MIIITGSNICNASNITKIKDITKLRGLKSVSSKLTVPCKSGTGEKCVCPGGCMIKPANNSNLCTLKKCWRWDDDQTKCVGTGPKFTPAIVLQAIPFTGVFGSGFGNMGRWDLFTIGSIIWGVGFGLMCVLACCCVYILKTDEQNSGADCAPCWSLYGCLFTCGLLAYWIWGIVVIANKDVLGPNGCPFVEGS